MKLNKFIFIAALVSQPAFSEYAEGYLNLSAKLSASGSGVVLNLDEKIPVYEDSKKESESGYLKIVGRAPWISIRDGEYKGKPLNTGGEDSWPLYSADSIKHYEQKNDMVRVLANRIEGGVWIRLSNQFEKNGIPGRILLRPTKWKASMGTPKFWGQPGQEPWRTSGYDGYRIRSEPHLNAEIIIELDKRWHIIEYGTGKVDGDWAEIVVEEVTGGLEGCYSFEELETHLTGKELTGWIKVLGNNGEPNFETGGIC